MPKVSTETGSIYEFSNDWKRVRRVEHTHDLRRDGEWLKVHDLIGPEVGIGMLIALEPLGEGYATYRTTSRVTAIEDA